MLLPVWIVVRGSTGTISVMIANLYELLAVGFVAFISYKWGALQESLSAQRQRESSKMAWHCDECGTSALAPDMESMIFVWKIHDENVNCSTKWSVSL